MSDERKQGENDALEQLDEHMHDIVASNLMVRMLFNNGNL